MSYEKPVKDKEHQGRRLHNVDYTCSHCGKLVKSTEPAVVWDGVHVSTSQYEAQLAPIAKLAAQTNPTKCVSDLNSYVLDLVWHTHCAVYFGGHLTKDGLGDSTVSQTLRIAVKE